MILNFPSTSWAVFSVLELFLIFLLNWNWCFFNSFQANNKFDFQRSLIDVQFYSASSAIDSQLIFNNLLRIKKEAFILCNYTFFQLFFLIRCWPHVEFIPIAWRYIFVSLSAAIGTTFYFFDFISISIPLWVYLQLFYDLPEKIDLMWH